MQSLIKSLSATQFNVLVNIFDRKSRRANLFILNVPENSNSLQQMYLTRAELNQLFTSNINEEHQSTRLTLKALLETTSTLKSNIIVYPQKHVKLTSLLPHRPVLPEPRNDPYWLMKKSGNISKCRDYKEDLGGIILGRLELDFFITVDYVKETKHWALSVDAAYYHASINCLRKRRPRLPLSPKDVKVDSSTKLDEGLESMRFS